MPRVYSEKFIRELMANESDSLGVEMGKLCVEAKLPATHVAKALKVSRMSLYSWFRGKTVSRLLRERVEIFVSDVRRDLKLGMLPIKQSSDAKEYLAAVVDTAY